MARPPIVRAGLGALVALAAVLAAPGAALAAGAETGEAMLSGSTPLIAWLTVLPILVPMLGSGLALALRSIPGTQAPIALASLGIGAVSSVLLFYVVVTDGPLVMAAGNWLPPFGIVLAIDALGALFVAAASIVGLAALSYARADIDATSERYGFYTFYCLLISGVCGTFSTGDIFNLYVWFEVFLVSSFGLIVLGGERIQFDGAVKYGVLNLIATTIFLIAVGALYGLTGTLNMADIRTVLAETDGGPVATIAALFVMAFAMKAAAFPLHFWLPASYHTPKVLVAAIFAGLLTKVGIYALMRVVLMLFGGDGLAFAPLVGWLGVITAILFALGALAQTNLRRMAAFLVISGIGVMLIGFGLGTEAGLAGAVVYAVHSILAMTGLFLAVGAAEQRGARETLAGGGLYAGHALIAALFLVFAFAASGLPPFSGFWPKLMLIEASLETAGTLGIAGVVGVIVSGFLTTMTAGKAWALVYLRPAERAPGPASGPATASGASAALEGRTALCLLGLLVIALGLFPQLVIEPAAVGASGLLDPAAYVGRVLEIAP